MTVTLTPEIETRLRAYAEDLDLNPEQFCADLLTRAFEDAEAELKDTMDGLDRRAKDFAAGRWLMSEEFNRRLEARPAAVRARQNGTKPAVSKTDEMVATLRPAKSVCNCISFGTLHKNR